MQKSNGGAEAADRWAGCDCWSREVVDDAGSGLGHREEEEGVAHVGKIEDRRELARPWGKERKWASARGGKKRKGLVFIS